MQYKTLHETAGQRIFAVVLAAGDEVLASLEDFIKRENIHAAYFTAIGALSDVVLLYFDWQKKDYQKIPVREQVEVASPIGDVADDLEGKATLKARPRCTSTSSSAPATAAPRPATSARPTCGRRWKSF